MENFEELEHNPFADVVSQSPIATTTASPTSNITTNMESLSVDKNDDKERTSSVLNSKTPVDVDVPAYVNDNFSITIHDPQTVGDGLKAHTTYSITTRTTSSLFRSQQMTAQRRFKEFLWLYQQLASHNPGVIVPPVPEKHALGRFDEDFVQNRRIQLERMIQKIAVHPILSKDPFFIMFLESENLQTDVQEKKPSKSSSGILSIFGDLNGNTKMQETDEYFEQKRIYIDTFDSQLKSAAKAIDSLIKHRESLSAASLEFGEAVIALAQSEINKTSERNLVAFAEVQKQMKDLYARQAEYDLLYLANTIDEYLRIVQSIRNAFGARVKAWTTAQTNEQNLIKLRISLEKTRLSNKSKTDKLTQIESEILEAESKVVTSKKEFEDVSKVLKAELENFEREKAHDIKECLKSFLKAVVAVQKGIVRSWEDYLKDLQPVPGVKSVGSS